MSSNDFPIVNAVSLLSSSSGSRIDIDNPLFILAASKIQFEIPTNATLFSPLFCSYSNSEWITLRGLFGECSASPISSKNIKGILFLLFSPSKFSCSLRALLNTFSIPFEVLDIEPWYAYTIIFGKFLNKSESEVLPSIDFINNCTLKDLLLPGLPTMKIGTLVFIATNNEKIFSNKALFFAIPLSIFILLMTNCSSFKGNSRKSFSLYILSKFWNILFIFICNSFRWILLVILK